MHDFNGYVSCWVEDFDISSMTLYEDICVVRTYPPTDDYLPMMKFILLHRCLPSSLAALSLVMATSIEVGWAQETGSSNVVRIETGSIRVAVVDNCAYPPRHNAGYNGVSELQLRGEDRNLFVPDYSGLNLEHFFNGDARTYGWHIFEPRQAPMKLLRPSKQMVELTQDRTEHWPIRSRVVYEVQEDAIEMTYYGTPLENVWDRHGLLGVFFASYIQAPEDMSIQFIGRSREGRGGQKPRWIKHLPTEHGVAANHRPAGSTWDPTFDEGFQITLASGFSDYEYLYPFYFGRSGDTVFVMMFEPPQAGGEMRFAQSPSGGGTGNPAWDFVYYHRDCKVGREFSFKVRAVYRKFTSTDDIVRMYEQWSGEKVLLPGN